MIRAMPTRSAHRQRSTRSREHRLLAGALLLFSVVISPAAQSQPVGPASPAAMTGAVLFDSLKCAACHNTPAQGINLPPGLEYSGNKFQTEWLQSYLLKPYRRRWQRSGVRPILRMPDFQLSEAEAQALAAFLLSKQDTIRFKSLQVSGSGSDSTWIAEGKEIYHEYACYGCHQIDGNGGKVGPDLSHVGSRLRSDYLRVFLKDPQSLIPGTAMKEFDFWEEEIEALVAYLATLR